MRLAGLALALLSTTASAQTVSLNGTMGGRALLVIDGQPRTLAVGASAAGVTLLRLGEDEAQISVGGRTQTLRVGGTPASVGGGGGSGGTTITLTAGTGGHFMTLGSINGRSVQFVVDTGATAIALSQAEAERIGLNYKSGRRVMIGTANGAAPAYEMSLTSVRVGDVEVYGVQAVIVPAAMPFVLLGNSFLSRFQMKRENDVMVLEKRF